jgi:NHLM bacteriocin system ABC transporter ATP-binding protein
MGTSIQAAIWDRLLSLPVSFFRDYSTGELVARSMGISEVRQILTGATLDGLLSGIFSVFSFALLFYYNGQLALVGTVLTFVALGVTILNGYQQLERARKSRAQSGVISGRVLELISGIAKFRVAGAEKRAFAMWAREFTKQKKLDYKGMQINNRLKIFNSVYFVLCMIVLFWYNAAFLRSGANPLSTGSLLAFIATFSQFTFAMLGLGSAAISFLSIVPIFEQAAPILRTTPEANVVRSSPGELTGMVEANHLIFRYRHNSPLILNDISFSVEPGQYVAFVGPSGCGKSTLFRLLLGFETPESGAIYFDKQDLAGIDVQAVRQQIGVVLQTSALISGSIHDNISGGSFLSVEDAWEAARQAGLDEDIRGMAMGLYTMVHEGGGGLSGGQRQRILIARAIAKRPRILMMDEATSALDNRTQAIVSDSLKSLKSTRIVIAHRLSTIIDADCIYVMDKGRIVQAGSYRELMKQPGLFREFAGRQLA